MVQWLRHFQRTGPGFDPWLGNYIPHTSTKSSCAATKHPHYRKEDGRPGAGKISKLILNFFFFLRDGKRQLLRYLFLGLSWQSSG